MGTGDPDTDENLDGFSRRRARFGWMVITAVTGSPGVGSGTAISLILVAAGAPGSGARRTVGASKLSAPRSIEFWAVESEPQPDSAPKRTINRHARPDSAIGVWDGRPAIAGSMRGACGRAIWLSLR